ncbi:ABC transporter ATP-binding protein [Paenibacillus wulumuqiensis]|uniref:ABC transporter ATP-binding protein n=1 Tax=Paenibacillus wulumuqiensis TaxID=1567107 RepID=UPI0006199EFD|nr:ABC transporter ATP-binding protein [Paenibacillus wulumuqiensis]
MDKRTDTRKRGITRIGRFRSRNPRTEKLSWKKFLKFYTRIKLPWYLFILTALLSFASAKADLLLVPYTSQIYQGQITATTFLYGFILVTLIANGSTILTTLVSGWCELISVRNMRTEIWSKVLRLPSAVHDREQPQTLISRVISDTEDAVQAPLTLITFFSAMYALIVAYLEMTRIYSELARLIIYVVPVIFLIIYAVGKLTYYIQYLLTRAQAELTGFFSERLSNIQYIKASNVENGEYEQGARASELKYRVEIRAAVLGMLQQLMGFFINYPVQIIALLGGAYYVRNGQMSMSHLVEFYTYSLLLVPRFFDILMNWQAIKSSHGATYKIADLMDIKDETDHAQLPMDGVQADIVFDKVAFRYDDEKSILKEVSFTIPHRKVTALIGANGSGKSTIFKLLQRFYEPNSGEIRIGHMNLNEVRLDEWRYQSGYVSQYCQLVPGTVADNIAYGMSEDYSLEDLIEAAKRANAYDFITMLPEGLNTMLDMDVNLSGGEMQRINIARAIMKNPDLLLLDEPTSNLDWISKDEVLAGLDNMVHGRTTLIITHDMEILSKADHIILVKDGCVEKEGTYEEVVNGSATLRTFLQLQKN